MTTALILAGKRDGRIDPLAAAAGVTHKCLVPVAGLPMIAHVVAALQSSPEIGRILISLHDVSALDALPEVREGVRDGTIAIVPSRDNLADSVISALAGAEFPVLITTADNVLLDPASISAIVAQARARGSDAAVAFTRRASVLAAHPDGQRRFYRFRDDAFSNCNAYWIGNRTTLKIAEVFRSGGQFAKHPARIIAAFGLLNLLRFRFGIGTLEAAFKRFSRRFRLSIDPVVLANGAVAIDVDNARTRDIAHHLLTMRALSPRSYHHGAGSNA